MMPRTELPPPRPGRTGWPWTAAADPTPDTPQDWPRVTVVTPSFNQAPFLEEAIRSVLLQGYPNLEYIVLDGGSTDGSVEIIRRYAPWLTHWASAPDRGQADALRRGFERATGEVLAWLNSDDVYLPGALRQAVEVLRDTPEAVMVHGYADEIDRHSAYLGPARQIGPADHDILLRDNNVIGQPAAFFRRAAYEAAGGLDTGLHWTMDYDLWFRLARLGRLVHHPQRLAQMRLYAETKTNTGDEAMFVEVREVVRRHGGRNLPTGMADWLEAMHLAQAQEALRRGDRPAAADRLAFMLEMIPAWRDEGRLAELIAGEAWRQYLAGALAEAAMLDWAAQVCGELPGEFIAAQRARRLTLSILHEALSFHHARQAHRRLAWRHAWQAIRHDPRELGNRGLWAVTARSLLRPARSGAPRETER